MTGSLSFNGQPLPEVAGSRSGSLLIIGTGRCLWDDLAAVDDEHWAGDRMVLNHAILLYTGEAQHAASLHPNIHCHFVRSRNALLARRERVGSVLGHCIGGAPGFSVNWPLDSLNRGTVTLFAVVAGLLMGYERIVLAGCPMDGSGHFYDPPWENTQWFAKPSIGEAWKRHLPFFAGRVESLSGNTKTWLEES